MTGASNAPFRIPKPRLIADALIEDRGANVFAKKLEGGQTAARDTMNTGNRGVSAGASQAMYAGQQEADAAAEGAQAAAGIRAQGQQFNEGQQNAYEMEREGALLFDKNQKIKRNQIEFDERFNRQQGNQSIAMARARWAMQRRLALMSKGLA
jgi:hypothetical protein